MGIVIDIIIVAVCALIIFRSARAGLVKSAMGLVKGIVSFIVAYAFTPQLSDFIYKNYALEHIANGIRDTIASVSKSGDGTYNLSKMFSDMPDAVGQIIDRYHANAGELSEMCGNVTAGSYETVSDLADYIAQPVADLLSGAAAFLGLLIGAFVVLSLVTLLLDAVFQLPILNGANRLLGLVFGIAAAGLFAVLFSSIAESVIIGLGSVDSNLFGQHVIESSYVMRFFSSVDLFGLVEKVTAR